jgi:hypothetical protein
LRKRVLLASARRSMAASGSKKDVDSDQITVNGATSFDSVAVGRANVRKPANTALKQAARLRVFIILLSDHDRFAQIAAIA